MKKIFLFLILCVSVLAMLSCTVQETCKHEFEERTKEATCTQNGYLEKLCKKCGYSEQSNFVYATGHIGDWKTVTPNNCQKEGLDARVCTVCNTQFETKKTPILQHDYKDSVVAPTCVDNGYDLHLCKLCGHQSKDNFVAPTGVHTEANGIVRVQPTCTKLGEQEIHCGVCSQLLRTDKIGVTQHDYEISYSVAPTATTEGYTVYKCSICQDTYNGDYVPEKTTASQIYESLKDAMVEILANDKNGKAVKIGSGFFVKVGDRVLIATNYHVIQSAYSLTVSKYDGTKLDVKLVGYNVKEDIALLLPSETTDTYLNISNRIVKTGDPVYALGSSLGYTDTFSEGIISNVERVVDGKACIQITAPISQGNSGGPLVNESGEVIGIITLQAYEGQNINFAIKSSLIKTTTLFEAKEISALYNEKFQENLFEILQNYIYVNKDKVENGKYYIYKEEKETAAAYGKQWYFTYDSATGDVYVEMFVISDGLRSWSSRFDIEYDGEGKFSYKASFVDCGVNQTMISATFDNTVAIKQMTTFNKTVFDASFKNVVNKYLDDAQTADNETEIMARFFYQNIYRIISLLEPEINASNVGITMDILGLKIEK